MIFLTGASNNHNDSFPLVLSFSSFCALHGCWRERCLPCAVISSCSSLSPCPVSSGPSLFFLSWGALGGGVGVIVLLGYQVSPISGAQLVQAFCQLRWGSGGGGSGVKVRPQHMGIKMIILFVLCCIWM